MSAILLGDSIVHYEVLGRGRPVIFLHGWIGSWRYWISAMQTASMSFRAYALDLWGFGDSPHEAAKYSLEKQAELINGFLEQLGIMKVALVGHGLGSLVAMTYAMQASDRVDRILAANCPLDPNDIHSRLRSGAMPELVDWLSSHTPEADSALADASKADPQAISASVTSLQANDLFGKFRQLRIPCLLVNGQNDPAILMPSPDQAAALPHNIHHVILDACGHFPMIEDGPKFNRLLTDFLALESGVSPRELQLKDEWKRRVR
jgi:pimeloyl-ACP methyl ester carboxylesterase